MNSFAIKKSNWVQNYMPTSKWNYIPIKLGGFLIFLLF